MTKKAYTVLKSVKVDGEEKVQGDEVALEPGQADKLLGVFVEEKTTEKASKAKTSDGL